MKNTAESQRVALVEAVNIQNYGISLLTEYDMWILRNAAENAAYLDDKLKEAELTLDDEAPVEDDELTLDDADNSDELSLDDEDDELTLDGEDGGDELSLDDTGTDTDTDELSLDDEDNGDELSLDDTDTDELSLDDEDNSDELSLDDEDEEDSNIETSKAGVGILPLISEIQDKLASGKPSEVELAALKALRKLV
jgi:hypothetical protein